MGPKPVPLFSTSLFLLILLLPLLRPLALASDAEKYHHTPSSPFEFVKHLQGCHKGDEVKDLHKLKKYLELFGYLSYEKGQAHAPDNDFDDLLESALKTYQLNYNIKPTGTMDSETVAAMMKPRCGVADIINGTTWMRSGKLKHDHRRRHGPNSFHTVAHYSFFKGNPRWRPDKSHLTYAFLPGTRNDAVNPVARAFQTWAGKTHFTFSQVQDYRNADITISFNRGDHGDGHPFDGRRGTLAHAFPPEDGRLHYDADEAWAVGATPGAFDLGTVALHEIGHILGLEHSSVEEAIMYPTIPDGKTKGLHADDVQGIRALYSL